MYRFLLSWRWLGAFGLALVLAAGCVFLGDWQWDRHEQRLARNALVTGNYDRPPQALDAVLGGDATRLPPGTEWTPVRLTGRYLSDATVLLRNRPLDGRPGYHALVPFETGDGVVLWLDRGWLPIGATGSAPDDVPAPPPGEVTVTARLRPSEPESRRSAPAGQAHTITPDALAGTLAGALPAGGGATVVTGAYGVLGAEQPAPADAPLLLPEPEIDEGPHLSYALQWFVFALGALVGFGVLIRRTAADGAGAAEEAAPSARVRRRRPSAEEEEDALVDARLAGEALAQPPVRQDDGRGS